MSLLVRSLDGTVSSSPAMPEPCVDLLHNLSPGHLVPNNPCCTQEPRRLTADVVQNRNVIFPVLTNPGGLKHMKLWGRGSAFIVALPSETPAACLSIARAPQVTCRILNCLQEQHLGRAGKGKLPPQERKVMDKRTRQGTRDQASQNPSMLWTQSCTTAGEVIDS